MHPQQLPPSLGRGRKHQHRHARGRVYYTTQAKNPGQGPTWVRIEPALYQKVNTIVNPNLLWSLQSKRNIKRTVFIHRGKLKRVCPALSPHPNPSTFRCSVLRLSGAAEYQIFTRCWVAGVLLLLSSIKAIITKSCHSCSSPGRAEGQEQLPLCAPPVQGMAVCPLASAHTQHGWHGPCGL